MPQAPKAPVREQPSYGMNQGYNAGYGMVQERQERPQGYGMPQAPQAPAQEEQGA